MELKSHNKKKQTPQWSEVTSATQCATKTLGDRKRPASGHRPWRTLTCWAPISTTVENETLQAHSKQAGRRQSRLQIKNASAKGINTRLQCS